MQPNGMIFWDWNGTLMDDVDFTHECLNWMLETHGYPSGTIWQPIGSCSAFPSRTTTAVPDSILRGTPTRNLPPALWSITTPVCPAAL